MTSHRYSAIDTIMAEEEKKGLLAAFSEFTDDAIYAAISGIIFTKTGAPVPPFLIKNTTKAVATLVTSGAKIPKALLEARASRIEDESEAHSIVTKGMAKETARRMGKDPALGERAALAMFARVIGEQENREAVVTEAIGRLQAAPPKEGEGPAKEIEADWLNMFARHAETKSSDEMRDLFARVLTGEIRKPGSFSAATVEALARISRDDAEAFHRFCNASMTSPMVMHGDDRAPFVLAEVFGHPNQNALGPVGLSYTSLLELQACGLIAQDLNTQVSIAPAMFGRAAPLYVADRYVPVAFGDPVDLTPDALAQAKATTKVNIIMFTRTGRELRRIVDMTPNEDVAKKFFEWGAKHGLQRAAPGEPGSGEE